MLVFLPLSGFICYLFKLRPTLCDVDFDVHSERYQRSRAGEQPPFQQLSVPSVGRLLCNAGFWQVRVRVRTYLRVRLLVAAPQKYFNTDYADRQYLRGGDSLWTSPSCATMSEVQRHVTGGVALAVTATELNDE